MKEFIKKLLNGSTEISSKRFISLYALVLFTIIVGFHLSGVQIQPDIIYMLGGMILGSSAMTLFNKDKTS